MASATPLSALSATESKSVWQELQVYLRDKLHQLSPQSVLQIGCAEGNILESLMRCSDDVPVSMLAALDRSESALEAARKSIDRAAMDDEQVFSRWRELKIKLIQGNLTGYQSDH